MSTPTRPSVTPMKVLRSATNKVVMVKVKDGYEFVGRLVMTDQTMNVVLEDATEYSDGGETVVARYGRVLIRGSQILYICTDYLEAQMKQSLGGRSK